MGDDVGRWLQVTAVYTDAHGSGKSETATSDNAVQAAPIVNTAPRFVSTTGTRSVDENTATGQPVGAAFSAEDDEDVDDLTYSLGGIDAGSFTVGSRSGQLSTVAALDFETRSSYSVRVTATDPSGETDFVDVTIEVVNIDEEGVAALDSSTPVLGTLLTASLSDPDKDVEDVSWLWQRSQDESTWTPIADVSLAAYTVVRDDQGSWLKAVATYTDGHGSDKTAEAETGTAVPPNRAPDFRLAGRLLCKWSRILVRGRSVIQSPPKTSTPGTKNS